LSGGVLIRGEKGTAKSTAARSLIELLPKVLTPLARPNSKETIWVEKPRPFITLPLNATEDRVAGGLDFEAALSHGIRRVNPGLLTQAHQGILYVDEVNLLDDHVVDLVLDAAASGVNVLEREGLSVTQPARFLLIGTMNPEEGELRPQFLDRFGLAVKVESEKDPDLRVRLTLLRAEFEADPVSFRGQYENESNKLRAQIATAQKLLPEIEIPTRVRKFIAHLATEKNVAGHRADLFLERAAVSLTALNGRRIVSEEEVLIAAPLALSHRQRESAPPRPKEKPKSPPPEDPEEPQDPDQKDKEEKVQENPERFEKPPQNDQDPNSEADRPKEALNEAADQEEADSNSDSGQDPNAPKNSSPHETDSQEEDSGPLDYESIMERVFEIGETFRVKPFSVAKDRFRRRGSGRRSRSRVNSKQGRYVKSGPNDGSGDLALDATIRAAAPYQLNRPKPPGLALALTSADIRARVREKKMGHHLFFVVDASGSMGAKGRMAAAKGAVLSLLLDAYQKRDQVALISFRRDLAVVNLPLTASVDLAGKLLAEMPTGGRTPLTHGLALTFREIKNVLAKNPLARPIVIFITDGRGNVGLSDPEAPRPLLETWALAQIMAREKRAKYLVVDTEEHSFLAFNMAARLAEALGADYFQIDEMKAQTLLDIVRRED
jgi:magnesium chelatase subunit D